ncbi:hypothetical protein [Winogradskyella sp. PG-2]|uniref:hypothetical protein n=1 Tax=Winogradskyella sp. PG-2 TaxID=754409 RepID=UPI0005F0092D|nr:hypothetical protein [Winogradskyella sp. PG-2]
MPSNSMNVINFNRKQLPQRDKFVNRLGGYNSDKKTEYNLPKASAKQLKAIAKRLREEQKSRMIKIILLTGVIFIGLLCLVIYS